MLLTQQYGAKLAQPSFGPTKLAAQAGSLARVRDGCKCVHILEVVPLRPCSDPALLAS